MRALLPLGNDPLCQGDSSRFLFVFGFKKYDTQRYHERIKAEPHGYETQAARGPTDSTRKSGKNATNAGIAIT
jgi:hypothetical protein